MILYQNSFIALDYNPYTDVLHVELPREDTVGIQELEQALKIVSEQTRNYAISRLLLDSGKVLVQELEDTVYREEMRKFMLGLSGSRLEKVAQVNSTETVFAESAWEVASEPVLKVGSSFTMRTFSGKEEALCWLLT